MDVKSAHDDHYFAAAEKIRDEAERMFSVPCSVALFGSFTSQSLHPASDIDLLIVSDQLPARPYDRVQWVSPLLQSWRNLQKSAFPDFPKRLSPLLITREGLRQSIGLRLSLANTCWILKDDGFLSSSLNEAREWIIAGIWTRKALRHGGFAWIPSKGVA